jgi:DDE superfamily endonuclease
VLRHVQSHTKSRVTNKILLLVDNHESHISLPEIKYFIEHGIVILSFPPHCSHKLQPLDVSVYGPFETSYKQAMADLMADEKSRPTDYHHKF